MVRGQILAWSWAGLNAAAQDFGRPRLDKAAPAPRRGWHRVPGRTGLPHPRSCSDRAHPSSHPGRLWDPFPHPSP